MRWTPAKRSYEVVMRDQHGQAVVRYVRDIKAKHGAGLRSTHTHVGKSVNRVMNLDGFQHMTIRSAGYSFGLDVRKDTTGRWSWRTATIERIDD